MPSKLELWVVDLDLEVDKQMFRVAMREYSDAPDEEEVLDAYEEELFPVIMSKPVPRLEAWMVSEGRLRIFLVEPYYLKEYEPIFERLRDKYDEYVALAKVLGISWRVFVERNYSMFVKRVKFAKAYRTRVNLSELPDNVRRWFEELVRLEG